MNQALKVIAKNLANLFYPLHCASCKSPLDPMDDIGVCEICKRSIKRTPRPFCRSCGRPATNAGQVCPECRKSHFYFIRAYSACLYEGALKELIHQFKYRNRISLGGFLSGLMADFINENPEVLDGVDLITFVPLQTNRLRQRTFNQSKILSYNLSKIFGIAMADTLKKTKSTTTQNELPREKRLVNLNGAFKVKNGAVLKDRRILLVDDVMTTGATLSECAGALADCGAGEIICLTLARGA